MDLGQLHGDGSGRIGDGIDAQAVEVVSCRTGDGEGAGLVTRAEHLVSLSIQSGPGGSAVIGAEQGPIGGITLRGIIGGGDRIIGHHTLQATWILILYPTGTCARVVVGKV